MLIDWLDFLIIALRTKNAAVRESTGYRLGGRVILNMHSVSVVCGIFIELEGVWSGGFRYDPIVKVEKFQDFNVIGVKFYGRGLRRIG